MNPRKLLALGAALAVAASAHAHRVWILPAVTVLSGEDQWVSFEAAVSNNLFFPNHRPVGLASIEVKGPDGQPVEIANATAGEIRSSFELHLQKQGTYVISLKQGQGRRPMGGGAPGGPGAPAAPAPKADAAKGGPAPEAKKGGPGGFGGGQGDLSGTYEENGKTVRWRGTKEELAAQGVASKPGFTLRESGGRAVVTFVTLGKPTTDVIKPTGKGIELDYVTHPNDLFTGEPATFRVLLDGNPAAKAEVVVVRGDDRYRDDEGALTLFTDADGAVKIDWPQAGRYWVETTATATSTQHGVPSAKSFTHIAIYEVLPH